MIATAMPDEPTAHYSLFLDVFVHLCVASLIVQLGNFHTSLSGNLGMAI